VTWTPAGEFEPPFCQLSRSFSRDPSRHEARRKADPQNVHVEQVQNGPAAQRRPFEIMAPRRGSAAGGVHEEARIPVKRPRQALEVLAANGPLPSDQDVVDEGAFKPPDARRLKRVSVEFLQSLYDRQLQLVNHLARRVLRTRPCSIYFKEINYRAMEDN
jgi:hypothetical protein